MFPFKMKASKTITLPVTGIKTLFQGGEATGCLIALILELPLNLHLKRQGSDFAYLQHFNFEIYG
jgi:hypothetical protein